MKKISTARTLATMAMALASGMSAVGPAATAQGVPGDGQRIQTPSNARQTMAPQASQAQRAGQAQAHYGGQYGTLWGSGSIFGFPAYNQRKARRSARQTNKTSIRKRFYK